MATKTPRHGRTLLVFLMSILVLFGLVILAGTSTDRDGSLWKPQLGLDLEGGTRITLTAVGDTSEITPEKLDQAAQIVEQRANGSGVAEAEVSVQGDRNVVVEIPGENAQEIVDAVKRTAQLRLRLVAGQPQAGEAIDLEELAKQAEKEKANQEKAEKDKGKQSKADKTKNEQKKTKNAGKNKKSESAKPSPTATPNPRPAPAFVSSEDDKGNKQSSDNSNQKKSNKKKQQSQNAKQTTKPSPSAKPSSPATNSASPSPTATPSAADADIDKPLEWARQPGQKWLTKYAEYACPKADEDLPEADDPNKPLLACDEDGLKYLLSKTIIEGTDLTDADYGIPQNGAGWEVTLDLKGGEPTKDFADYTRQMAGTGELFATVLDGRVIQVASIREPILNGNSSISGSFTQDEARSLAQALKFGALPLQFESTTEVVGATLAGSQFEAGLWAGLVGLIVVMVYCLFYYRGLGLVVIASLFAAAGITYGSVLLLGEVAGFTLTLPGIAGLIVAVGITADSFIVYFERIRDEMRAGKSMRVAVEAGWISARKTCLAADAVSLMAAVVLYIFAIGVVKGFAFALGLTTLIDVIVFFFFTKPAVSVLARRTFFNSGHKLSGLSEEALGVDQPQLAGGKA